MYLSGGDILNQISDVVAVHSTIVSNLVPDFCTVVDVAPGSGLAAIVVGTPQESVHHDDEALLGPGVATAIAAAAGLLVAVAMILLYRKRRNAYTDCNPVGSGSNSDLEHNNASLSPRISEEEVEHEIDFSTSSVTDMPSVASSRIYYSPSKQQQRF